MGYTTYFSGEIKLNKKLSDEDRKLIEDIAEGRHEEKGAPSYWCQWIPTPDNDGLEWDGGEKFYGYVEWMEYLISKILAPKGYIGNGTIEWQGEEHDDVGRITVKDNDVSVQFGEIVYPDPENKAITVDIDKVAEIMQTHGFGDSHPRSLEGWSNTLLDTLQALYDIETLVSERLKK